MRMTDRFELPVTAASAEAVADYVAAVDLLLSATPGADARLERALAADPDFALAQIARARLLQLQARIGEARAAAERATALAVRASTRERGHVEAIARAIAGDAPGALALVQEHAAEYPRDALPLSLALGVFGLLGFSGRRDHHEAQLALLEGLAPHWPEDWWFLGYLGWAEIETGAVAAGTRRVERSLELNPRNAHGAHQRAHGYFEAGDAEGGAAFIADWLPGYQRAGHLHCHLSWHLALFELARGDSERAMAVYRDAIRPTVALSVPMLSLADSASFLWRWQIYEHEAGAGRRMEGGRGACPAPLSAGEPRFCRSACRLGRSGDRRRRGCREPDRRSEPAGRRGKAAIGRGGARAVRRRSSAGPRRSRRSRRRA